MPKAEAQRILECRVSRMQFDTKEETDVFSACLQNNYGHAGKVYIKHVMENLEEVQKLLRQVQEKVDARAGPYSRKPLLVGACCLYSNRYYVG